MRILFVFAALGGEADAALTRLASALDPARHRIDAVVCFRPEGQAEDAAAALESAGVAVDTLPCQLSLDETVGYLAGLVPGYDAVVSCGDAPDLPLAVARLHLCPPVFAYTVMDTLEWQRRFDAARRTPAPPAPPLFRSFWQGGFECSTHRRAHDRARIDVIAATRHDVQAERDYRALQAHGMATVRDGLRWHLIEAEPGRYDWSSLEHQLAATAATGTEVIWDLLHYGWPDDIDVWSPAFVRRFAAFAAAAAAWIGPRSPGTRFYSPVNEISFLSWGGGDAAYLNPFAHGRGFELKVQLARAAIAAMEAILVIDPAARFVHADPVVNIVTHPDRPWDAPFAEGHRQAQFQGWDLIAGRLWPQIGGRPELLDIVGVNYYHNNQWVHGGAPIDRHHPQTKPFHRILAETYARYGRPIFIAETGIEGDERPAWLTHVAGEVREAQRLGVPVAGLCLYPVLDHPGWDDDRACPNGLLHSVGSDDRGCDARYAAELLRQRGEGNR